MGVITRNAAYRTAIAIFRERLIVRPNDSAAQPRAAVPMLSLPPDACSPLVGCSGLLGGRPRSRLFMFRVTTFHHKVERVVAWPEQAPVFVWILRHTTRVWECIEAESLGQTQVDSAGLVEVRPDDD